MHPWPGLHREARRLPRPPSSPAATGAAAGEAAALLGNQTCSAPAGGAADGDCHPAKSPRIEVLHEDARIFLYHNFLSEEECDHVISLATPTMERSG